MALKKDRKYNKRIQKKVLTKWSSGMCRIAHSTQKITASSNPGQHMT
jgi:hypothetical protein